MKAMWRQMSFLHNAVVFLIPSTPMNLSPYFVCRLIFLVGLSVYYTCIKLSAAEFVQKKAGGHGPRNFGEALGWPHCSDAKMEGRS